MRSLCSALITLPPAFKLTISLPVFPGLGLGLGPPLTSPGFPQVPFLPLRPYWARLPVEGPPLGRLDSWACAHRRGVHPSPPHNPVPGWLYPGGLGSGFSFPEAGWRVLTPLARRCCLPGVCGAGASGRVRLSRSVLISAQPPACASDACLLSFIVFSFVCVLFLTVPVPVRATVFLLQQGLNRSKEILFLTMIPNHPFRALLVLSGLFLFCSIIFLCSMCTLFSGGHREYSSITESRVP